MRSSIALHDIINCTTWNFCSVAFIWIIAFDSGSKVRSCNHHYIEMINRKLKHLNDTVRFPNIPRNKPSAMLSFVPLPLCGLFAACGRVSLPKLTGLHIDVQLRWIQFRFQRNVTCCFQLLSRAVNTLLIRLAWLGQLSAFSNRLLAAKIGSHCQLMVFYCRVTFQWQAYIFMSWQYCWEIPKLNDRQLLALTI